MSVKEWKRGANKKDIYTKDIFEKATQTLVMGIVGMFTSRYSSGMKTSKINCQQFWLIVTNGSPSLIKFAFYWTG